MWRIVVRWLALVSFAFHLAFVALPAEGDDKPLPLLGLARPPSNNWEVSAAEQTDWIDTVLPRLLAGMKESAEMRTVFAGTLAGSKVPAFQLLPNAKGIDASDLVRWTTLADTAVGTSPLYRAGRGPKPRHAVTVMPHTGIARVEATYPAPPASGGWEPRPLVIDAWICPDRDTALALLWLRKGGIWSLDPKSPETVKRSVLAAPKYLMAEKPKANEPGEAAYWDFPRMSSQVDHSKADEPLPLDRFSFLRGNVVVEASTIEFIRRKETGDWLAGELVRCGPDIVAIMRSIDAALIRLADRP